MEQYLLNALNENNIPAPPQHISPNGSGFYRWGNNAKYYAKKLADLDGYNFGDFSRSHSAICINPASKQSNLLPKKSHNSTTETNTKMENKNLAQLEFKEAQPATNHPYLTKKQVKAYGIKQINDDLLIPAYDNNTIIQAVQYIKPNGQKLFNKGGSKKGHYHLLGNITDKAIICEGYATGASIFEATDVPVVVAFDAGNILPVGLAIKQKYPEAKLLIAADNDIFKEMNTGLEAAKKASSHLKCSYITPIFKDISSQPSDFNDLARLEGLDTVKLQISNNATDQQERETAATKSTQNIMRIIKGYELFHDDNHEAFITIQINHKEISLRLDSKDFTDWLIHQYWKTYNTSLSSQHLETAISILSAKAKFEGCMHKIFLRVGELNGTIYVDTGNKDFEIIEVTKSGWKTINHAPIKFFRPKSMQPLPDTSNDSNIDLLWQYINIPTNDRILILAWILACFRVYTPFPILALYGQQGSAKSTTQEYLRKLIDPSKSNLRSAPTKADDWPAAAANNWVISFNNLSSLTKSIQDMLCNMSTGGGIGKKKLYKDSEEHIIEIKRPVAINGINDLINAPDLLERSICITLDPIPKQKRSSALDIEQQFIKDAPLIFTGLLDLLVSTLSLLGDSILDSLEDLPRMADFAKLGTAIQFATKDKYGDFLQAYDRNQSENIYEQLDDCPIASSLTSYLKRSGCRYYGTFGDLYKTLSDMNKFNDRWPKTIKKFSWILRRQIEAFKAIGVHITPENQRKCDGRYLTINFIVTQQT